MQNRHHNIRQISLSPAGERCVRRAVGSVEAAQQQAGRGHPRLVVPLKVRDGLPAGGKADPDHKPGRVAGNCLNIHLREVCDILARGLLRLRSRAGEKTDVPPADRGERLLHFTAHQRRHANPTKRRDA